MAANHPLDQELGELWYNRDTLDRAGWERLYTIVCSVLIPYRSRHLSGLAEEREELVQDFFESVVMRISAEPKRYHVGGLKYIYQNFLITCHRAENRHDQLFVPVTEEDETEEDRDRNRSPKAEHDDDSGMERDVAELREAGWSLDRLQKSVRDWLARNEPWVSLYLSFHYCADAHISETLQKLAKRFGIKSYAYKAKALGFNWDMEKAVESGEEFSQTLIGRWLTQDLDILVCQANKRMIHMAFKILCLEALHWADEQESAS